jgi:nucleotide-binding universal stress UspA family protein
MSRSLAIRLSTGDQKRIEVVMTKISPVKVTFDRILVPTDFSDASLRALEYAKAIAGREKSEILLVHVNQPVNPITPPEAAWIDESEIIERQQLDQSAAALRSQGFRAESLSRTGDLQDEIFSAAKRHKGGLDRGGHSR